MQPALEAQLRRDFPRLFRYFDVEFSISNGWEPLLRRLCNAIAYPARPECRLLADPGGLKAYNRGATGDSEDKQYLLQEESFLTCGEDGRLATRGGWMFTACQECMDVYRQTRKSATGKRPVTRRRQATKRQVRQRPDGSRFHLYEPTFSMQRYRFALFYAVASLPRSLSAAPETTLDNHLENGWEALLHASLSTPFTMIRENTPRASSWTTTTSQWMEVLRQECLDLSNADGDACFWEPHEARLDSSEGSVRLHKSTHGQRVSLHISIMAFLSDPSAYSTSRIASLLETMQDRRSLRSRSQWMGGLRQESMSGMPVRTARCMPGTMTIRSRTVNAALETCVQIYLPSPRRPHPVIDPTAHESSLTVPPFLHRPSSPAATSHPKTPNSPRRTSRSP
ncbi:hypothetical protein C8F01DRAFT_1245559 [Mycena amicta]|nr:hypothetical protein C8F01DRAFT_1245559 [Mycena amicta]